jgi:Zn finger protein HypA/HybF involved in hydrogenase expression
MPDSTTNPCGDCGHVLDESPSTPVEQRAPCPECGSVKRKVIHDVDEPLSEHRGHGGAKAQPP